MNAVRIEIPAEVALSLKLPSEGLEARLTGELALCLYREGLLSFGKARTLAQLSKWEFAERLGKRRILRHYTPDCLEEDIRFAHDP